MFGKLLHFLALSQIIAKMSKLSTKKKMKLIIIHYGFFLFNLPVLEVEVDVNQQVDNWCRQRLDSGSRTQVC